MLTFVGDKDVVIISMMMMDQVDCTSASVPLKRVTRKVRAKNSCAKNKSRMWVARLVMLVMVMLVILVMLVMVMLVLMIMVMRDCKGDGNHYPLIIVN